MLSPKSSQSDVRPNVSPPTSVTHATSASSTIDISGKSSLDTPPRPISAVPRSRAAVFVSYYRPYLRLFLADMACALVVAATTLLLPLCARSVTTDILGSFDGSGSAATQALDRIYVVGALMLALVGVRLLSGLFVDYQGHMMGARMEADLRRDLFAHLQRLSFRFYDEQRTGQLMTRMTNDTLALVELYHHGPEDIVVTVLTIIGVFVILVQINVPLTLVLLLLLPAMAAFALHFNRKMLDALRVGRVRVGDINAQVEDSLAGIRVVQSFTNEEAEAHKFARTNARLVASRRAGYLAGAYFSGGLGAFAQALTVVVIIGGGIAIVHASLTVADLLTYLLCIGILADPIKRLTVFASNYQEGITGFHRVMDILEEEPDLCDTPSATALTTVRGDIEFRDVRFQYREGHDVLAHLSLRIRAGEYVALVGASGVGKTTLCSLIPRFYDVSAGAVTLDGRDIRAITLRSLRAHIGVVQQEVYLFAGTIAENIGYGCPQASRQEIIAAATRAQAHEFIAALPEGYDTDIGQRGVRLSGGQKQRLGIARVFLKDPPILLLDEATSALDNASERAVQEALDALARDRTTLVIAHRLSTIRNARRIVVLSGGGGIAEEGTHEELLARNGIYADLYAIQTRM